MAALALRSYLYGGGLALYGRKSDPEAKVIPKNIRTGPLIICRTRLTTTRGIDQIQPSLKNYSECSYITDLVSVINFNINRYIYIYITLENTTKKQFTDQYSNTATCKLIVSVLGSSRC